MPSKIWVELVYALPSQQKQYHIEMLASSTVQQVVEASGVLQEFPELQIHELMLGIWGRRVTLEQVVQTDDRIEIYRPLVIDPKQARKAKAKKKSL